MKNFKLNLNADSSGTSLKGHVFAKYSELVNIFGSPIDYTGGENKVSGLWVIEDAAKNIYTIYDWKATNLYSDDMPSVEELRNSDKAMVFNVGGRDQVRALEFINELNYELAEKRNNE